LQYNWRDKGDEDPSAVVTFGIHRGNDKVIFRGETRLTGQ
jgi:MSHA biogenesis protein MshQ